MSASSELLLSIRDRESMEVRAVLDEFACVEAAFQLGGFRVRLNDAEDCPVLLVFCPSRVLSSAERQAAVVLMAYAMEAMRGLERLAGQSFDNVELREFVASVQDAISWRIDSKADAVGGCDTSRES